MTEVSRPLGVEVFTRGQYSGPVGAPPSLAPRSFLRLHGEVLGRVSPKSPSCSLRSSGTWQLPPPRWPALAGGWNESVRPHPQAGRAVPQGLWTGECNITAYWGASHPSRDFLATSEVAVASGCERGRQETNETFFSLSHLPFSSTFPWRCQSQEEAGRCSRAGKLTSHREPWKSYCHLARVWNQTVGLSWWSAGTSPAGLRPSPRTLSSSRSWPMPPSALRASQNLPQHTLTPHHTQVHASSIILCNYRTHCPRGPLMTMR